MAFVTLWVKNFKSQVVKALEGGGLLVCQSRTRRTPSDRGVIASDVVSRPCLTQPGSAQRYIGFSNEGLAGE